MVTVPAEAVRAGQRGSFVYIVDQGVARLKPVKAGRTVEGRTEILEGLQGSETVVTDGQLQLIEGAKVELKGQPQGAAQ
jgi:acyl dehydratase